MQDRFIRDDECRDITGLSRSTRWRLERQGNFPKRHKISNGCTAYKASEIEAWMQARSREDANV